MSKSINVLSLFDGMSCGQIALNRAGFKINEYYASEIDKYAIQVAMSNYPKTIQIGSVVDVDDFVLEVVLPEIDILIGGSPCQSFSFAGKMAGMTTKDKVDILSLEQYLKLKSEGFEFEGQSYLFWEYVRVLTTKKPKYFLLENVKMVKKWEDLISETLGVRPRKINSSLVSAQNRQRLYWTNLPDNGLPEDRGLVLRDILENGFVDREKSHCLDACYYKGGDLNQYFNKSRRQVIFEKSNAPILVGRLNSSQDGKIVSQEGKSYCHTAGNNNVPKVQIGLILLGHAADINGHDCIKRVYSPEGKSPTLTAVQGGHQEPKVALGYFTEEEMLKPRRVKNTKSLQDKSFCLLSTMYKGSQANGMTILQIPEQEILDAIPRAEAITFHENGDIRPHKLDKAKSGISECSVIHNANNKTGTITTSHAPKLNTSTDTFSYRKLTPIECERLQTVPDNYTSSVSNSQRYKMLGNGWTVDVVAHIFSAWKQN